MVMRVCVSDPEADWNDIQEKRIWQGLIGAFQILACMEAELIGSGLKHVVGENSTVDPAVVVGQMARNVSRCTARRPKLYL